MSYCRIAVPVPHFAARQRRGCHSFLLASSAPGGACKRPRFGKPPVLGEPLAQTPEALICLVSYFAAFFARSQSVVKAAGSWIAVSESILRFMSRPASFRPCINVE